ncbi:MAG: DUF935 family protein [Bacteroidetes bacterium]|nr:DUF935 family protein [Bacteroidota bacterium]
MTPYTPSPILDPLQQFNPSNVFIPDPIRNDGYNLYLRWLYDQTTKTIPLWQTARYQARANRYYTNRWPLKYQLIDFYEEILKDTHLYAIVQNRKAKVLGTEWSLVSEDGVADLKAKRLLQHKWFDDFQNHTIDALFYGYSLIQLDDVNNDGEIEVVHNIERRNVVPEYNSLRIRPTDYNTGIDLSQLSDVILIDTKSLGIYELACVPVLYKRSAMAAWTEHSEIFSTNFMIAKVDVNDADAVQRLKNDLQAAGRERIAILAHDESLELKEQSSSDTYRIYKELIETLNAEMSKLFVGQTMTSDKGSSYAQANVHQMTAQEIAELDQKWVAAHINDMLIPKLISEFNYPLKGLHFKWNDSRQAPLTDKIRLFDMLGKYFDISAQEIEANFGVDVEPKLQTLPDTSVIDDGDNTPLPIGDTQSIDGVDTNDNGEGFES